MDSEFNDDIELIRSPNKSFSFVSSSENVTVEALDNSDEEDNSSLSDTVLFL